MPSAVPQTTSARHIWQYNKHCFVNRLSALTPFPVCPGWRIVGRCAGSWRGVADQGHQNPWDQTLRKSKARSVLCHHHIVTPAPDISWSLQVTRHIPWGVPGRRWHCFIAPLHLGNQATSGAFISTLSTGVDPPSHQAAFV